MRIAFLYTELADYTLACMRALRERGATILVIHYPVNPEAPFRFEMEGIGTFRGVKDFADYPSLKKAIDEFNPDKIVCSGWINKWYVRYCRENRHAAICVLTLDNQWTGSVKQQALRILSRYLIRKTFHKAWVPGKPQVAYARKLGFKEKDITAGFYCCDTQLFNQRFEKFRDEKRISFPRRFLCVARYIPAKGYERLWQAFIEWKSRSNNDWELWCAGTGENYSKRVEHNAIKHLGFIQRDQWDEIISRTGVFVLASTFEPWGVAVQEFAVSGYPLLLSKEVGASSEFLTSENGYDFDPTDKEELIGRFELISKMENDHLAKLADASNRLGMRITPEKWAADLYSI